MAKKNSNKNKLIAAIVIIVLVLLVLKYKGIPMDEADNAAEAEVVQESQPEAEAPAVEAEAPVAEAQPLYPDLCYAKGGVPKMESKGCQDGEKSIGEVPGFKVPYLCCVTE